VAPQAPDGGSAEPSDDDADGGDGVDDDRTATAVDIDAIGAGG